MMKALYKFSILSIILIFGSCMTTIKPYVMEDSGKTINLNMDDPFEVALRANGSTGYEWIIMPYDETVLQQVGDPTFVADDDRIGSGGMQTFHFKTIGEGATTLTMVYKRKWEEPKPDDQTFELKVVCGTMGRILDE
jgi:predicted secreted protein